MNTLKPLLIVAILGGIGYGVYIRLNAGNDAPPPPVSEGWDNSPKITLPETSGAAPWGPSGAGQGGSAPAFPPQGPAPGAVAAADAPPFDANHAAAPPAPGVHDHGAPNPGAAGGEAAPFHPGAAQSMPPGEQGPPGADPSQGLAPAGPPVPGAMPPGDVAHGGEAPPAGAGPIQPGQPQDAGAPGAAGPPADPYADSAADPGAGQAPDRYSAAPDTAPAAGSAPPVDPAAADYAPPAGQAPYPDQGPPNAQGPPNGPAPPAGQGAPDGQGPPGDVAPVATVPGSGAPSSGEFASSMTAAQRELEGGQLASALRQLSSWYDHPQLAPQEQQQLNSLLDQVAGTVVYSTQNLMEPPYEVQPGEKLRDIGDKYNVPWQLLAKINGIEDAEALQPGERLKVIRGPFQAVVSLEKRELTLFTADGSYAGRFKCGLGTDQPPQEGTFAVSDKMVNPVYYGPQRSIPADDANNPLGERWIGLGKSVAIHGTNQPENVGRTDLPGSITLSETDAEDVFDILSLGSKVTIRR